MTQSAIAQVAGCSTRSVRQAELGLVRLPLFEKLVGALGRKIVGRSLPPGDTLGGRLASLRVRTGQSRRCIAAVTRISATTVASMERGEACNLVGLEAVADALGAGLALVPVGQAEPFYAGVACSSPSDAWATPLELLERLYVVIDGCFDLDPCSPGRHRSRVRAIEHFNQDDDGLAQPWDGTVYLHPPHGRTIGKWTGKAKLEVEEGRAVLVVGLLPARTDTIWWHRHVAGHAAVWLLKGRLAFGDGDGTAPSPSALVIWGGSAAHRERMSAQFPDAWPAMA